MNGPPEPPPRPGWVKAFLIVVLVVIVAAVVIAIVSSGHGPGRHMSAGAGLVSLLARRL